MADKQFHVRIRTVLVPLCGAALYYFAQNAAAIIVWAIFPEDEISAHQGSLTMIALAISAVVLFVFLWFGRRINENFLLNRISTAQVVAGVTIGFGMLGIVNLYMIAVTYLADKVPAIAASYLQYTDAVSDSDVTILFERVLMFISVSLIIPVMEEILFRGIIMSEFLSAMGAVPAIILSAIIFGLFHGQPIQIGYAIVCGVILGCVYFFSKSLILPIIVHSVFNFFGSAGFQIWEENQFFMNGLFWAELIFIFALIVAMIYLKRGSRSRSLMSSSKEV